MPMSHPVASIVVLIVAPVVAMSAAVRPVDPAAVHVAALAGAEATSAVTVNTPPASIAAHSARHARPTIRCEGLRCIMGSSPGSAVPGTPALAGDISRVVHG